MDSVYVRIPLDSHSFYDIDSYYLYMFQPLPENRRLTLEPLDINCMFSIYKLTRKGEFLGLGFRSATHVIHTGAYIIAYMQKRRQSADESVVLMRTKDIVIYNYPNVGTLAVSPKINSQLTVLLEEQ